MDLVTRFLVSDELRRRARMALARVGRADEDRLGDLLSIVSLYALEKGFQGDDPPPGWMGALCKRASGAPKDTARRNAAHRKHFEPSGFGADEIDATDSVPARGPTPLETLCISETVADINAAIRALSGDQATALLGTALGASGAELAELLGRKPEATRALLCRARDTLLERLIAGGVVSLATAARLRPGFRDAVGETSGEKPAYNQFRDGGQSAEPERSDSPPPPPPPIPPIPGIVLPPLPKDEQ